MIKLIKSAPYEYWDQAIWNIQQVFNTKNPCLSFLNFLFARLSFKLLVFHHLSGNQG